MKENKPAYIILDHIKQLILELPPEERKQLSDELIAFLLFDRHSRSTIHTERKIQAPSKELNSNQLKLIKALGEQTRNLNNLMGDDLYFFM